MRYLVSINEKVSSDYQENLKFLAETSGYNKVNDVVKVLATDVCDELQNAQYVNKSVIYTWYKMSNRNQGKNIVLTSYLNNQEPLSKSDEQYFTNFLAKTEIATKMQLSYTIGISTSDVDENKVFTEITNLVKTLKSMGWDAKHWNSMSFGQEIVDFKKHVRETCKLLKSWIKNLSDNNQEINKESNYYFINISEPIDINLFKPGNEYLSAIPDSIISDFETFCNRFRMNSSDKQQLAEIIKKAQNT
jgi:hypothetical protein